MKLGFIIVLISILMVAFNGQSSSHLFDYSKKTSTEFLGINFMQIQDNCEDDKNTNVNDGVSFLSFFICFLETPISNQVIYNL